jgi:hypothetical protein
MREGKPYLEQQIIRSHRVLTPPPFPSFPSSGRREGRWSSCEKAKNTHLPPHMDRQAIYTVAKPYQLHDQQCPCADIELLLHKVCTYKEYHSVCPSSELGLPPTPHPQASVPPPPCFWGEGNTRWRERGWESPNSYEGHTLWYSLYVRTLCPPVNGMLN